MRISLPIAALAMVAIGLSPVVHADEEPSDEIQEFPARPAGEIDASEEAIARDIELLGADEGAVREAATLRLFWIGEPARAARPRTRRCATGPGGSSACWTGWRR